MVNIFIPFYIWTNLFPEDVCKLVETKNEVKIVNNVSFVLYF